MNGCVSIELCVESIHEMARFHFKAMLHKIRLVLEGLNDRHCRRILADDVHPLQRCKNCQKQVLQPIHKRASSLHKVASPQQQWTFIETCTHLHRAVTQGLEGRTIVSPAATPEGSVRGLSIAIARKLFICSLRSLSDTFSLTAILRKSVYIRCAKTSISRRNHSVINTIHRWATWCTWNHRMVCSSRRLQNVTHKQLFEFFFTIKVVGMREITGYLRFEAGDVSAAAFATRCGRRTSLGFLFRSSGADNPWPLVLLQNCWNSINKCAAELMT